MESSSSCLSRDSNPTPERGTTQKQRPGKTDTSHFTDISTVTAFKIRRPVAIDTSHPPDFTIIVKEERIPVQRTLLELTCHYFHCLFECEVQETKKWNTGSAEHRTQRSEDCDLIPIWRRNQHRMG